MALNIRPVALAMLFALMATPSGARAQSRQLDFKPLNDRKAVPSKADKSRKKACTEYGAGFYRMEGSDTCVRIGGGIDVTVGSGRDLTNAPGLR